VLQIPQLKHRYDVRDSPSEAVYPPKKIGTHPEEAIFGKKYVDAMYFFKKYARKACRLLIHICSQKRKKSKIRPSLPGCSNVAGFFLFHF
jgi:hypothetical protein